VSAFGTTLWTGISATQSLYLHRTAQHRKTRTNIHALSGTGIHDLSVKQSRQTRQTARPVGPAKINICVWSNYALRRSKLVVINVDRVKLCLRTAATSGPIAHPVGDIMSMESHGGVILTGENRWTSATLSNTNPIWINQCANTGRRVTAWAMALPVAVVQSALRLGYGLDDSDSFPERAVVLSWPRRLGRPWGSLHTPTRWAKLIFGVVLRWSLYLYTCYVTALRTVSTYHIDPRRQVVLRTLSRNSCHTNTMYITARLEHTAVRSRNNTAGRSSSH
jgi:hypothetical protein